MANEPGKPPDAYQIALIVQNLVTAMNHAAGVSESNATHLVDAFKHHADALVRAAEASDKAATRLVWATWALVSVTLLLVIIGILQVIILFK